jgi:hypothetical protein
LDEFCRNSASVLSMACKKISKWSSLLHKVRNLSSHPAFRRYSHLTSWLVTGPRFGCQRHSFPQPRLKNASQSVNNRLLHVPFDSSYYSYLSRRFLRKVDTVLRYIGGNAWTQATADKEVLCDAIPAYAKPLRVSQRGLTCSNPSRMRVFMCDDVHYGSH